MKIKITDTIRILCGLRDGGRMTNCVETTHSGGLKEYDMIEIPGASHGRVLQYAQVMKTEKAGLIERRYEPSNDHRVKFIWILTAAGWSAAAALPQITVQKLMKQAEPQPAEKLAVARHKRAAQKIIQFLTFSGGRIRDRRLKFLGGGGVVDSFAYRDAISDGVLALLEPHCETFVDTDGKESRRITQEGIAATGRKRRA